MNKFTVKAKGNIAIVQFPEGATDPEFDLKGNGSLFVYGYSTPFMNNRVGVAKSCQANLIGYKVFGLYSKIKDQIIGDISELLTGLNLSRCVVLCK